MSRAPVARNEWQTLRVEFQGTRIRVILNSKTVIEQDDDHIKKIGAVGVWTKEDSVKRSIILRGASVSLRPERDQIAPRHCPN